MPIVHFLASVAIGTGLFVAIRWIGSQSRIVQAIVAGGLLIRTLLGLSLFWISYLRLPVLESLQLGGGFWTLMIDATGYYKTAAGAVDRGLFTISSASPSPFYTRALAVWMDVVGVTPPAGLFLNLCLYVASCVLLTRLFRPAGQWREDMPLILASAAISFSPVLLIDSTQPLKDALFFSLVVAICAAAMRLLVTLVSQTGIRTQPFLLALLPLSLAVYAVAGVRPYYPLIVFLCLVVALGRLTFAVPSGRRLRRAITGVLVLVVLWCAYAAGAGPQIRPSSDERRRITTSLHGDHWRDFFGAFSAARLAVTTARTGFVVAGGETNVVKDRDANGPAAVAIGLALIVVPISVLNALSVTSFSGGRGMLIVTDADTMFMDCSLIALGLVVFRRRHLIGDRRVFVLFVLVLAAMSAVLLGYVVTNFGTLFRMRYLVATPLWMLVLAVSPARVDARG